MAQRILNAQAQKSVDLYRVPIEPPEVTYGNGGSMVTVTTMSPRWRLQQWLAVLSIYTELTEMLYLAPLDLKKGGAQ